ncbi:hypothetical protein ACH5RR_000527 [Cinchona calisaya]|uniref:Uncharacterized protein n=1 Tax=Cinchona calisaya TaxID=153742 RepID=A0ABD3B165_9GENT
MGLELEGFRKDGDCGYNSLQMLPTRLYFMDKNETRKEVSEEVRELLIAISYTAPETQETAARISNKILFGETLTGAVEVDGKDKYRSELISISYPQSTDTKSLPVLPGESRD